MVNNSNDMLRAASAVTAPPPCCLVDILGAT